MVCGLVRISASSSRRTRSRSAFPSMGIRRPTTGTAAMRTGGAVTARWYAAIELLQTARFRDLYAGLLCTIDVANDPLAVYEALMALRPPRIDFLLPHATWDHPPVRRPGADHEYADWLTAIYDRWLADGRPAEIRTFDSIISTLRGGDSLTEALGLGPTGLVVIETDGSYEQVDSLKVAYARRSGNGAERLQPYPRQGRAASRHRGPGAGNRRAVPDLPGVPGRRQLRRRLVHAPVPGWPWLRQPVRVLRGPALADLVTSAGTGWPCAAGPEQPALHRSAPPIHGAGRPAWVTRRDQVAQPRRSGAWCAPCWPRCTRRRRRSPAVAAAVKAQSQAAWSVLTTVDQEQPAALAVLLGHPYLRAWAVRCLARLRAGAARPDATLLGHLGAVAAAAAARGGLAPRSPCPYWAAVHLPDLGRLRSAREPGVRRCRPGRTGWST